MRCCSAVQCSKNLRRVERNQSVEREKGRNDEGRLQFYLPQRSAFPVDVPTTYVGTSTRFKTRIIHHFLLLLFLLRFLLSSSSSSRSLARSQVKASSFSSFPQAQVYLFYI